MDKLLFVFLGGGAGSALRYSTGVLISRITPKDAETPHWLAMYPVATLLVNIIGCGLIGLIWSWAHSSRGDEESTWLVLLVAGFLGGFTTFSSFGWETLSLVQDKRVLTAIVYVLVSVGVGLVAAWSGYSFGASTLFRGGAT